MGDLIRRPEESLPESTMKSPAEVMTDEEYALSEIDTPDEEVGELDSEEVAGLLSQIVSEIDRQERTTRDYMLGLWKYLELLWSGSGNSYWDYSTNQYRAITQEDLTLLGEEVDIDPSMIDKVINLYRPYGESLVGVLTTGIPRVRFFPDDADKDLDIQASKEYTSVEEKINNDNYMTIRLMEMLVKLWNGGFAAVYNYTHTDAKYGMTTEDILENRPFESESLICTKCGEESLSEPREKVSQATEEEAPETDLSLKEDLAEEEPEPPFEMPGVVSNYCPGCDVITPHIYSLLDSGMREVRTGTREVPKSRIIIKVYGPMNVKIPSLAKSEEDIIWLIKEEEKHIALARHMFPEHRDKIEISTGSGLDIDRVARATYEIASDTLAEYPTIRWVWLRPASFEILADIEQVNKLKRMYPTGVKAIFAAERFLEAEEENMDDCWTISINPLYDRIQGEPLGKALVGLDEAANDLFQLEVDTVRFSIPETFVDPKYVDLEARKQSRALPGAVTAMTRPPGGRLEDNIATTKTATIPREVENLDLKIEKLLQFISGVLPSVFGGPGGGSKTLGEYQESKNQALQRLSIIWKIITVLYARVQAKATRAYVDNLREDEHFVKERGKGNYINVWIRRENLEGKIGEVRPEISEQFPATWGQISTRVMELLGMNNELITSWFLHPENVELIYKILGISELYVPGEDQRNKQLYEIGQLILSEPLLTVNPQTGGEVYTSSVQPEPIDDPQIHMAVIQAYLNSPLGIELKVNFPPGYQNMMLHYQEHQLAYMQMQAPPEGEAGSEEVEEG